MPLVKVFHRGEDGWKGEHVRIILDDGTHIYCYMGGIIVDNISDITLDCDKS